MRWSHEKIRTKELYQMMFPDYPDIVNITQLQTMLGISRHLAYDLINGGYIKGLKIGNAFRIPKQTSSSMSWIKAKVRTESVFSNRTLRVSHRCGTIYPSVRDCLRTKFN